MKKGAVPIPYIIALLLGIAVVAILGYWFFVLGGQWGGEVTLQNCRSKATIYCTRWQANGYEKDDDGRPSLGGLIGIKWFSKTTDAAVGAWAGKCEDYEILGAEGTGGDLETSCKALLAPT